jgi:hypothetical protein
MRVACFYMHARRVGTENLDARNIKIERPRFVRESTYMRSSSGSRRRSASRYLPRARVQDSLLRFVRFST